MRWAAVGLLGVLLIAPGPARGQSDPSASAQPPSAGLGEPSASLPVSLERIKRRLLDRPAQQTDLLRLQYYVEVYGKAPKVDLFAGFDLRHGPVPFTAPTHQDILEMVTPQEFRSPPVDVLTPLQALFEWLRRQASRPEPH